MAAEIVGLVGRVDLNGQECRLLSWDKSSQRWVVQVGKEKVLIRPSNLAPKGEGAGTLIKPQDVLQRLDEIKRSGHTMTCDALVADSTSIIALLSSKKNDKALYKTEL